MIALSIDIPTNVDISPKNSYPLGSPHCKFLQPPRRAVGSTDEHEAEEIVVQKIGQVTLIKPGSDLVLFTVYNADGINNVCEG